MNTNLNSRSTREQQESHDRMMRAADDHSDAVPAIESQAVRATMNTNLNSRSTREQQESHDRMMRAADDHFRELVSKIDAEWIERILRTRGAGKRVTEFDRGRCVGTVEAKKKQIIEKAMREYFPIPVVTESETRFYDGPLFASERLRDHVSDQIVLVILETMGAIEPVEVHE